MCHKALSNLNIIFISFDVHWHYRFSMHILLLEDSTMKMLPKVSSTYFCGDSARGAFNIGFI